MNLSLSAATDSMRGVLHGQDRPFAGVSTDTRTLQPGELFFALKGPNFDGAEFLQKAIEHGAAGAVVDAKVDASLAQIVVENARPALGALAKAWRAGQSATVVGVTGSNGKTTLKEMIAACLARLAPTVATQGNLNNDIGLPLMLFRIESSHRFAVLEMGANHAGEIAYLTSLARPDVVVITNAGDAHLEGFGSREGVAHAKGEILQGIPRPAFAILNADDEYFDYWRSLVDDVAVRSFGFGEAANIYADEIVVDKCRTRFRLHTAKECTPVVLPMAGLHNVRNACAAAAVATALGVSTADIVTALQAIRPVAGRLQPIAGRIGATLYDDSYNANPQSVIAAGDFLASLPGQSCFVLGDMKELGPDEQQVHRAVGKALKDAGVARLFAFGELSRHAADAFGEGGNWCASIDALISSIDAVLTADLNILVKGSRSMRMERVVAALRAPEVMRREA